MPYQFRQVDVFTDIPYFGNPVAVVLGADALSTERMQLFARWTNLSETTFVQAPRAAGADYLVRIFTPTSELPFAGHPTLGTCHAWLEAGGRRLTRTASCRNARPGWSRSGGPERAWPSRRRRWCAAGRWRNPWPTEWPGS